MELIDVAAALLSAVLHAGWNAAVKANRNPTQAMAAQMLMAALIVVPGLFWTGLPPMASWPWIAASTAMNVVTIFALLRAYELGGFGIVYPIGRAVAVVLVVPMAALMAGDRLSTMALLGIAVMVAALGVLSVDAARGKGVTFQAMAWTLAAGLGTAAYILCDARGVRTAGEPLAYGFVVSITNALAMCWRVRAQETPWGLIAAQWKSVIPIAVASTVSYLLILWVWSHAPIAPAAALRDTSAVFAILIAVVFLKEPFTRTRIASALLAAAAIPLLRLS
jgi:drug/metabolite transporter (DMT)-like permease